MRKVSEHSFDGSATVGPETQSRLFTHECPLGNAPVAPCGAEPSAVGGLSQFRERCRSLIATAHALEKGLKSDSHIEEILNTDAYRVIQQDRGVCPVADEVLLQLADLLDSCDVLKADTEMTLQVRGEMLTVKPATAPIPPEEDPLSKLATDIWQLEQDISKWEKALGLPAPLSGVSKFVRRRIVEVLSFEGGFRIHVDKAGTFDTSRVNDLLPQSREHLLADYEAQRAELLAQADPGAEAALARFSERMEEVGTLVANDTALYLTDDLMRVHQFLTRQQQSDSEDNPVAILATARQAVAHINEIPAMRNDWVI